MRWAEHWLFLFPLWHGTMPALLKGFLEQILRPARIRAAQLMRAACDRAAASRARLITPG